MQEDRWNFADQPEFIPVPEITAGIAGHFHGITQTHDTLNWDTVPIPVKLRTACLVIKPCHPSPAEIECRLLATSQFSGIGLRPAVSLTFLTAHLTDHATTV